VALQILEYYDPTGKNIVHRIPPTGSEAIKFGAQLIVQENQEAIFIRDGKALDVFKSGRHTLSTMNLPILTKLLSIPFGSKSPFRAAVFFVNKGIFSDMKWGTKQPINFRDKELSIVRLRAFGNFTMRVTDSMNFVNTLATQGKQTSQALEAFLKDIIVSRLNWVLGKHLQSIFDLPSQYDQLGVALKLKLKDDFLKYGIEMIDLFIQAITPPDNVQKMIDERTSMAAIGDMNKYLQFKTATSMGDMAKNPGAGGGAMSLGFGAGFGMMFPQMMNQAFQGAKQQPGAQQPMQQAAPAAPAAAAAMVACPKCGQPNPAGAKFCSNCGTKMQAEPKKCPKCNFEVAPGAKFCPNCGNKLA